MTGLDIALRRIVAFTDAAAAIFLLVITVLTFTAVLIRYVFQVPFPGSFDVSRLLLGVAILWGIAVGAYRGSHITVDILWQSMPRPLQRLMDLVADLLFVGFMGLFAWMLLKQVQSVARSGQTTFELSIPIWPFYAVAWLGVALCVLVLIAKILRALSPDAEPPST
jgi:TRAP-type C4-dicarboxylate transport system permease small subunit